MIIDPYIGIDPGKSGAIVLLYIDGSVDKIAMPVAGKALDIAAACEWIYDRVKDRNPIAIIEKVHSMPGQGVSSTFSFGFNVGVMHGIITSMMIPLYVVAPPTWKRIILKDTKKDKDAAIAFCRRTYPSVSLLATERSRVPHIGIADALCIAHYGYTMFKDLAA